MSSDINALIINHKPISEIELKRMLLIFDHVHIIDPHENEFIIPNNVCNINYGNMKISASDYGLLYQGTLYKSQEELLIDTFDYAYKKGILRVENPRHFNFYEQYWLPLRLAYDFDTANETLLQTTKSLMEDAQGFPNYNGVLRGFFIQPSGVKIYPDIPEVPPVFEGENKNSLELQAFSALGKLDRSLLLSGVLNLIPAFTNPTMAELFIIKSSVAKDNSEKDLNAKFSEQNKIALQNIQYLLFKISQVVLPDQVLKQIPVKELIIARNNTFEKLLKLRRNLANSISFLTNKEFGNEFTHEVDAFVNRELIPQIKLYESSFSEIILESLGIYFTFASTFIGSAFSYNQFLSPLHIAIFSGISATVGAVSSNLVNYLYKTGKNDFKNTYSYFLDFRE